MLPLHFIKSIFIGLPLICFSISKKEMVEDSSIAKKSPKKEESIKSIVNKALKTDKKSDKLVEAVKEDSLINKAQELSSQNEINIVLKKSLTDREQLVFEYFLNNINKTVFAKDLAELLELPRDYVYKYIKNLRAKIEGDKLKNVPSGGFILSE